MKNHFALLSGSLLMMLIMTGCGYTAASSSSTSGYGASPVGSTPTTPKLPVVTASNVSWLRFDKATKSASLDITAAKTDDNAGFNYNGYSNGAMTVTVPIDWHVNITFTNNSTSMSHSLVIVTYSDHTSTGKFRPAFSGATTSRPEGGITSGQVQHFTFIADKEGKYAFVCAVPGHAAEGLWDTFLVSPNATTPTVVLNIASTSGVTNSSDSSKPSNSW